MLAAIRNSISARRAPVLCAFIALASAPALHAQDPFEPNDSCAFAAPLPLGTTTMLSLGPDDDYYLVAVSADARIGVSATAGVGNYLSVELYEVGCPALPLASSVAAPLLYADCGGAMRSVVIRVLAPVMAIGLPYEISVSAAPIVDDSFEPNDSCPGGAPSVIRDFSMPGLVVTRCNEDWWAIGVQPNDYEVQIEALFDATVGGLDLELLDNACISLLASTTTAHGKALRFVNISVTSQIVKVRVSVTPGSQLVDYALSTCFGGAAFTPLIGHQACMGVPNSTGMPAAICAWGDTTFTPIPDVNLYIGDLPANSFGYFLTSQSYLFTMTPGNSSGNLCLGAPGRYSFAIQNSGAGFVAYSPNPSLLPIAGGGFTAVQPGDRWHWQYWYRDAISGVTTSNFSSALYVDFP